MVYTKSVATAVTLFSVVSVHIGGIYRKCGTTDCAKQTLTNHCCRGVASTATMAIAIQR